MPFLKPGYVLKDWQTDRPLLWRVSGVVAADRLLPARASIQMMFAQFGPGRGSRLQTWAREEQDPDGPHWIGVRHGIKLHTDPGYRRYTHQLVVHNDGWRLAGLDERLDEPLAAGTAFCCDTHSPHQLLPDPRLGRGLYYLAVSMDAKEPLPPEKAVGPLLAFLEDWRRRLELEESS